MMLNRRARLLADWVCPILVSVGLGFGQRATSPPAQPPQTPPPAQQNQPPQGQTQQGPQRQSNPFETVPVAPVEPQQPPTTPPPATVRLTRPGEPPENVIEAIEFRGSRRVPQDTLRALIFTKRGDKYDE